MDIFNVLTLIGGVSLFLFGMNVMGQALERCAGNKMRALLEKITSNKIIGLLTGLGITAIIQSSGATTVMAIGFVNSGLMTLSQAINVVMGANIGTTITGWILSINSISGESIALRLLKPSAFSPVLAMIGIILFMFNKKSKRKDQGLILLGFATLMFGMETMTSSMSGLSDMPSFRNAFTMFENPLLGLLAGIVLTTLLQSSSASVGIIQALAVTGVLTNRIAVPLVMGTGIGSCTTALLAAIGSKGEAKRVAYSHLFINVVGTVVGLILFLILRGNLAEQLSENATSVGVAALNTGFKVFCVLLVFPFTGLLEKFLRSIIPNAKSEEKVIQFDERLLRTPSLALERCKTAMMEMAGIAMNGLKDAFQVLDNYDEKIAEKIKKAEDDTDEYEDAVGNFLISLSTKSLSKGDSALAAEYLKLITDFERIGDHAYLILRSAEEMREKGVTFSEEAWKEFHILRDAVSEIADVTYEAFTKNDERTAIRVEPLEQVIDHLKEQLRSRHIRRQQQGECTAENGFIWNDLLTNMERISDHCSNIAGCVIDTASDQMNLHATLRFMKTDEDYFRIIYQGYDKKYNIGE